MVDSHIDEGEVKEESIVQAEGGGEDVGMKAGVDLVQESETALPAHEITREESIEQDKREEIQQPQSHVVDSGTSDTPEGTEAVDSSTAEQEEIKATETIEDDKQAHSIGFPVDDTKDVPSDNVQQPAHPIFEIFMPADIDIQPENITEMEVETAPAAQIQDDSSQAVPVDYAPPMNDEEAAVEGQHMRADDAQADPAEEIPASTPAGTPAADIEDGKEEIDHDIAPTPEAEAEAEAGVDTDNADIEMDGSSLPTDLAPVAEVKIRKKPGPKPKPKQVGQKVEAAAKKAVKGIKGKKVDELRTSTKKNARFTPVCCLKTISSWHKS